MILYVKSVELGACTLYLNDWYVKEVTKRNNVLIKLIYRKITDDNDVCIYATLHT